MSAENPAETTAIAATPAASPTRSSVSESTNHDAAAQSVRVAVLIPCYNEEGAIAEVVKQFRAQLPAASIYVFDNNSTDKTAELARQAGATVRYERRQGKGFVTQSMFRQVDADIYVMVDGDNVFPASAVHRLMAPVLSGEADMVVGSRLHSEARSELKQLNRFGNRLVLSLLNSIFGVHLTDILSGYRAFSRKFVKGLPLFGGGFEIEAELTIKGIERGYRITEVPVDLTFRTAGNSKVNVFRDGLVIVNTILALFRDYRPLTFFGALGLALLFLAVAPAVFVVFDFQRFSLFMRLGSAMVSVGLVLCGLLSITVGLVLHSIARRSQELEYQLQVITDELRPNLRPGMGGGA